MAEDVRKNLKTKEKRKKGPKTIIAEEPVKFKGDLFESSNVKSEYDDLDLSLKVKNRDEVVVERYNPDTDKGLSLREVEARLMAGYDNDTTTGSSKTVLNILFTNTFTFFNILTFGIAGWIISTGAFDQLDFLIVILANLVIGIIQEIKAKNTIDNLSLLSAPTAIVIRDGNEVEIAIKSLVLDDIMRLSGGKQISADAVLRSGSIEVDESLLTGESDIIVKNPGDPLYSGSFVVSGTGHAQVVAVGHDIYVQKLTSQAKKYRKPKSELFSSLKLIIRVIGVLIIPMGISLFLIMTKEGSQGYNKDVVLKTSGAVIGMIPSGLFLLTSSALAVGVIRLAQNNTLVQELYVIEMLARTDVLCLDKTGTITDGTMTVHSTIEFENKTRLTFKNIVSIMLNAQEEENLTSKALIDRFGTARRLRSNGTIPFSSARKYSAASFDKYGTFLLGAPEFIVPKEGNSDFYKEVVEQSKLGYRVLTVAHSKEMIKDNKVSGKIVPIGLIMIEDTIRPDAIETIDYFKKSGVAIRVISGDNPMTVSRIAQRAGIVGSDKYISLDGLTDNEVIQAASEYIVFGRVSPNQKKILVEAIKSEGHTVAMTGDGVNDILALREADTSIALASGSEAARNVAHLVLLDSNFSSMPKVVQEGRRVINNIQKLSGLFLAKTLFSVLLATVAIIGKGNYPITPKHLMPINILVIGLPTFFLAMESNNDIVEGSFLVNVLKGALPGALVILINSLIIIGLNNKLEMTQQVSTTLIVLTASVTMFILLFKISQPFNKFRGIIFATFFTIFLLIVFLRPDIIDIAPFYNLNISKYTPLSISQTLLLLVLIQSTYPLLYVFENIVGWIRRLLNKIVTLLTNL